MDVMLDSGAIVYRDGEFPLFSTGKNKEINCMSLLNIVRTSLLKVLEDVRKLKINDKYDKTKKCSENALYETNDGDIILVEDLYEKIKEFVGEK